MAAVVARDEGRYAERKRELAFLANVVLPGEAKAGRHMGAATPF